MVSISASRRPEARVDDVVCYAQGRCVDFQKHVKGTAVNKCLQPAADWGIAGVGA